MKCVSCDDILTDREASRKGLFSGEYLDLCDSCIATIPDLEFVENPTLSDKRAFDGDEGNGHDNLDEQELNLQDVEAHGS